MTANSTGSARTGTIIFRTISGGLSVSLEVTQFGDAAFSLTLSTDTQAVSYVAQENAVDVISNTAWSWETDADWIDSDEDLTQNEDGLSPVSEFTYSVTENTTGSARTGRITFVTAEGNVSSVLEVTQLSSTLDTLTLESNEINLESATDSDSVVVRSNTSWNWTITQDKFKLLGGQNEGAYNDVDDNGVFTGGDGAGSGVYVIGDVITLSDRSTITVEAVDANGDVTEFTVNSDNSNPSGVTAGDILTQVSLDGAGTDTTFTLTPKVDNIDTESGWLSSGEGATQNGDERFSFSATTNTFATPRTATITFTTLSGEAFASLTVTQDGSILNLSASAVTISQDGTDFFDDRISVTSDTQWTWTKDVDWIDSDEGSPQNSNLFFDRIINFDYRVAENTSGATRVGTITFTTLAGDIERTFVITQAGTLTLSETEHVNTSQDQDRTFTVFAADDVDWVWASDVTWLTDAEPGEDEQQTGEQEFTYNVEENTTGETRTGSITFFTTTGNISASIEVTQLAEQVPNLALSNTDQANSFVEQNRTVQVFSNTDWIWESSDPSWLTGVGESLQQSGNEVFDI